MLLKIFVVASLLWAAYIRYKNRHKRKMIRSFKKHNLSRLPIIGVGHHLIGNDEDRMKVLMKFGAETLRLGGLTGDWVLHELLVIITDPDDVDVALRTTLQKSSGLEVLSDVIGNGHLYAKVHIWRPRRKIMTPIFTQKNLNNFVNVFSRLSEVTADKLKDSVGKGSFSIWKYIAPYSLDGICETNLGTKAKIQSTQNHQFLIAFEEVLKLLAARVLQPWLHPDFVYKLMPWYPYYKKQIKTMQGFVKEVIKNKREEVEEAQKQENTLSNDSKNNNKISTSFLELLLKKKNGFNDQELQEEMLVLAMAGTDTTAVSSSFTVVLISQHPEVQEKLHDELLEVFGNSDRPVTPEDLIKLKYLEAVIKESMRLYPPSVGVARLVEKDFTLPSGFTLVEGTTVLVHIWAMHRNPKYWGDDANEFRPERFYNTTLKHPGAYMPFSTGPRNCIGWKYAMMSMMTLLANLLRRYKFFPSRNIPVFDPMNPKKRIPLRTKYGIMTKHADDYQVEIERREPF